VKVIYSAPLETANLSGEEKRQALADRLRDIIAASLAGDLGTHTP
jgi:hypothetical protein